MALTPAQRVLLSTLARRDTGGVPVAVAVSSEQTARQLADLGILRVEPHDDLGLMWVVFTPVGREFAAILFGGAS